MIVIDLGMIYILEYHFRDHNTHLAQTFVQHPPVPHKNLTLVLTNAPQVMITPFSDAINILLLPNHVLIATEVDVTLIRKTIRTTNII